MKLWFYTIKTAHHITGEIVSMEFGVVRAVDVDSAREKVWAKIGSDHKYDLEVFRLLPGRFFSYWLPASVFKRSEK